MKLYNYNFHKPDLSTSYKRKEFLEIIGMIVVCGLAAWITLIFGITALITYSFWLF